MATALSSLPSPTALLLVDSRFRGNDVWELLPFVRPPAARMRSRSSGLRINTIPIDSLRLFSESPAILHLFGARRLSQHNLIIPFPSPEEVPVYTWALQKRTSLAFCAACGHRTRLRCLLQPLRGTVLPELLGEPETLLVDSTLLEVLRPRQADPSAAEQSPESTKDSMSVTPSQHLSRRLRARSLAKQRRRPSHAGTTRTFRSAPLDKPIMVGGVCL
jgi:hypothetical protein